MFSDTHFHFTQLTEKAGFDGASVLESMAGHDVFFGQDIGTDCSDLSVRQAAVRQAISGIASPQLAENAERFMHFSAGIWPSPEAVKARSVQMPVLERQIYTASASADPLFRKIAAVGECGIDHHWNPSGADGRSEDDFTASVLDGEKELFKMQLDLARRLRLPVVVHSRDAFRETLGCIGDVGYDRGVIHCFSYGRKEAEAFLNRGWYISFSGAVTYTKKNKLADMTDLLKFIPEDRILLETDAPYLAPVPMRGTENSPNYISYTYEYIAAVRGVSVTQLCSTVDTNSKTLFVH